MTDRARVFTEAQTVLRMFLQDLDQRAPGLFPDVSLVGSLALDDARPGKSDIDVVLVCRDSATNDEAMAALGPAVSMIRAHYPQPGLDGIVLLHRDLALGPEKIEGDRPVIFEGNVTLRDDGSLLNPVTWQILRQGGITWRGRALGQTDLHHAPELLQTWTRGNLESYWRPWLAKSHHLLSPFGAWSLRGDFVEWGVLGVTRLHYTLATGKVTSKAGAGTHALETFPEYWHLIAREAMDIRSNPDRTRSLYRRDVLGRRNEARDYIAMVIEDALRL